MSIPTGLMPARATRAGGLGHPSRYPSPSWRLLRTSRVEGRTSESASTHLRIDCHPRREKAIHATPTLDGSNCCPSFARPIPLLDAEAGIVVPGVSQVHEPNLQRSAATARSLESRLQERLPHSAPTEADDQNSLHRRLSHAP